MTRRSPRLTERGDIHLHDLSMLTGYCAGWSLKQLIQEGLGGIPGKITSSPAKHLSVALQPDGKLFRNHAERVGRCPGLFLLRHLPCPVCKGGQPGLTRQVKKCIESFIYGVNTPSRWGTQAPFSNITLDWTVPDDMAEHAGHRRREGNGLHLRATAKKRWT